MQNSGGSMIFSFLPGFAEFILKQKLRDFIRTQIRLTFKVDFPILKYYDLSQYTEEQLIDLSVPSYTEFLVSATQNKLKEHLNDAISKWESNQLPNITRDQLIVEDITLATYIRKKTFLEFVPEYTSDVRKAMELIGEIEDYTLEAASRSFNTYVKIQQEKANEITAELQKYKEQTLEAQEIAALGNFEWDLLHGQSNYTPQVFKIFEMEKTSTLDEFMKYVLPGDREKLKMAIDAALKGESDFDCEYRFRKKGKEKVLWSRGVVTFKDGKPAVMKGTVMDITDRHYMLQRLQRNEELYKQAQKITHIGNWTWNLQTLQITWSDEMYRIYGLEPQSEQMTYERFMSFVHADDKQKVISLMESSLKTNQPHEVDFRIVRDDSSIRIIRRIVEVLIDDNGKPYKILGTGQDITREKELYREIQEREETFAQLINNAPDAIVVIDETSRIILWNPKTEQVFGWKMEEVIGKTLQETILPKRYQAMHSKGMERFLATGEAHILNKTIEVTALNYEGKEFYISLTISQSVKNGRPVFISFIRDISEEKQIKWELENKTRQLADLNVSLEQKNKELEQTNKELMSFSYVASHDLQEPLRKIKTFSGLIMSKENENFSDEGKEHFQRIVASTSRMQKLIDDLLSFSRTQVYDAKIEAVDLNSIINEIKHSYLESKKELDIVSDKLPVINGIGFQLQQLFENIVSNSVKYARDNVPLVIRINVKKVNGVSVPGSAVDKAREYYDISIHDNGIGFEQKYSEKIFEIFQRLHGKNEYGGTGIGLAICKKIVENHKGFISATGIQNKGATFHVYFPVQ